jgi:peptidoglycan hydrolase-like protein with peptidoglycan-binding domain
MSRLVRVAAVAVVVVAGAAGGWWLQQGGVAAGGPVTADGDGGATDGTLKTATVERRTLTVTEEFDATLGYTTDYDVLGGLSGTLTWAVPAGTVVTSGQLLYETDGVNRAALMYGSRPAWRTLKSGVANGADVRQLEENLRLLGFTRKGDVIDRHWDSDTTAAVKRWQTAAGVAVDGEVELGEVVFLPESIRVTEVQAKLGSGVGPGGTLMTATSNRRVVSLDLDATDVELINVGDAVSVELPDGTTVDGAIATIGRVAESSQDQQGGTSTTLPVTISLDDPAAAGDLDPAPVTVPVVRDSRENVLTVPVNALLALIEGGYAVEVVDSSSASGATSASPSSSAGSAEASPAASVAPSGPTTHLVRVEPGLFDNGHVEITADGLEAGDLVVVPS